MLRPGRSIDDGMVVAIGGEMHYGADATRKLAEIGQPATHARRFLLWFVGQAPWASALYPALSAGRRGLLRLLGRPLIGSADLAAPMEMSRPILTASLLGDLPLFL